MLGMPSLVADREILPIFSFSYHQPLQRDIMHPFYTEKGEVQRVLDWSVHPTHSPGSNSALGCLPLGPCLLKTRGLDLDRTSLSRWGQVLLWVHKLVQDSQGEQVPPGASILHNTQHVPGSGSVSASVIGSPASLQSSCLGPLLLEDASLIPQDIVPCVSLY